MCGRFTSAAEAAQIEERFGVEVPAGYRRRYNVAPTDDVLTVVETAEGRRAELKRWGLVPQWAKSRSSSGKMINARVEGILERAAYRSLVGSHRCLVPADGFYEWASGAAAKKGPVRFTLAGVPLFAFAGLWTSWVDRTTGELVDSCTIVTTRANELVAEIHDRMPAILRTEDESTWLDLSVPAEIAASLLVPYPADRMRGAPASARVNSVANDDSELLAPDPALV